MRAFFSRSTQKRGTTERDEMMMFSFDSFFYNTHTRTNTEKTNRASVLSKSLERFFRNEDRNSERVHACVHARPICVRFRNWFQMTKNASVCCLSFEIFCAFLKGECDCCATRYARSVYRRALDILFQKERVEEELFGEEKVCDDDENDDDDELCVRRRD